MRCPCSSSSRRPLIRSSKCEMWSRSVRSIKNWILGQRFAYSANMVVNTPSSSAEVPLGSSVNGRSHSPNSLWCKLVQVWVRGQKLVMYPQALFVESAHGDGHAEAAGEARGDMDCAYRVGSSAGTSVLPEVE